ncbi:MAG TPA: hypothetical protein V6C96_01640, partial [Vampirovibrionales bacterium]
MAITAAALNSLAQQTSSHVLNSATPKYSGGDNATLMAPVGGNFHPHAATMNLVSGRELPKLKNVERFTNAANEFFKVENGKLTDGFLQKLHDSADFGDANSIQVTGAGTLPSKGKLINPRFTQKASSG